MSGIYFDVSTNTNINTNNDFIPKHTWHHFTKNKKFKLDFTKVYNGQSKIINRVFNKPPGFRLSYNDDWYNWYRTTRYYIKNPSTFYAFKFNLDLRRDNILVISELEHLVDFIKKFSYQEQVVDSNYDHNKRLYFIIDWQKTATKYNGIAFLNYGFIKAQIKSFEQSILQNANLIDKDTVNYSEIFSWYMAINCSSAFIFNKNIFNRSTQWPDKLTQYL